MLGWGRKKRETEAVAAPLAAPSSPPASDYEQKFRSNYFANTPVDLDKIQEFRNEAFPPSGPACWVDQPNALLEIERRKANREITVDEAAMAEKWTAGWLLHRQGSDRSPLGGESLERLRAGDRRGQDDAPAGTAWTR